MNVNYYKSKFSANYYGELHPNKSGVDTFELDDCRNVCAYLRDGSEEEGRLAGENEQTITLQEYDDSDSNKPLPGVRTIIPKSAIIKVKELER
jgi:hypothetical protein